MLFSIPNALGIGDLEYDGDPFSFVYYEEFSWVFYVILFGTLGVFAAQVYLGSKYAKSQKISPVNNEFLKLPPLGKDFTFWTGIADGSPQQYLVEYTTPEEQKSLNAGSFPIFFGILMMVVPHGVLPAIANSSDYFPDGPNLNRILLVLAPLIIGLLLIVWGVRVGTKQLKIDERLILDFEKKELQKIAMHDAFGKPQKWFEFRRLKLYFYVSKGEGVPTFCQLLLAIPGLRSKLLLAREHFKDGEQELQQQLRQSLKSAGLPLEVYTP